MAVVAMESAGGTVAEYLIVLALFLLLGATNCLAEVLVDRLEKRRRENFTGFST